MKKSILNLVGTQELTKGEQKSVNGGYVRMYCSGGTETYICDNMWGANGDLPAVCTRCKS